VADKAKQEAHMASSISPLSYLDTSAYQSLPPASSSASASGASAGVSATAELQAIQKQGSLHAFFNDSMGAALLQLSDGIGGTDPNALMDNMLQQVLGAYQSAPTTSNTGGTGPVG
jgi:hypothetical protein